MRVRRAKQSTFLWQWPLRLGRPERTIRFDQWRLTQAKPLFSLLIATDRSIINGTVRRRSNYTLRVCQSRILSVSSALIILRGREHEWNASSLECVCLFLSTATPTAVTCRLDWQLRWYEERETSQNRSSSSDHWDDVPTVEDCFTWHCSRLLGSTKSVSVHAHSFTHRLNGKTCRPEKDTHISTSCRHHHRTISLQILHRSTCTLHLHIFSYTSHSSDWLTRSRSVELCTKHIMNVFPSWTCFPCEYTNINYILK